MNRCFYFAVDPENMDCFPTPEKARHFLKWLHREHSQLVFCYIPPRLPMKDEISERLASLHFEKAEPRIRIRVGEAASGRAAVEQVIAAALSDRASLIAVCSRGRSAAGRLFFGSFTETLIEHSPLPVLVIPEQFHCVSSERDRVLFFATDFTDASKRAFLATLEEPPFSKQRMILFSGVYLNVLTLQPETFASPTQEYFSESEAWALEQSRSWQEAARLKQMDVDVIIQNEGVTNSVAEFLMKEATDRQADLVVLSTTKGPISSLTEGSTARNAIRSRALPVLIYGRNFKPPVQKR